ncbi:MAG: YigZ family protein [Bacteroidota bacterium]
MHLFEPQISSEGFFKDRGSKFYSYAYPFKEVEELEIYMAPLKKKYYDARHHCYAYRLGVDGKTTFANDDREPAHSAGTPILSAIKAHELTNTLIIVVRYFGGTKLGIRGLIEAYGTAAKEAIAQNKLRQLNPQIIFSVRYPYTRTSEFNKILHPFSLDELKSDYAEDCHQTFAINEPIFEDIKGKLVDSGFQVVEEGSRI